jgi:hypothetical protein
MYAVTPCIAQLVVASPSPGSNGTRGTNGTPGTNPPTDGAKSFGSWMKPQTQGTKVSGPAKGDGPLRDHAGPAPPAESALSSELITVITKLRKDERTLDNSMRRALAGHDFDMPQLVALQSLAFKYSQRVELMGKLIDRLTGALKQTLQMQV